MENEKGVTYFSTPGQKEDVGGLPVAVTPTFQFGNGVTSNVGPDEGVSGCRQTGGSMS